ncbi:MAG: GWxTD domain-containing protein [Gemmatimonadales bacterium]
MSSWLGLVAVLGAVVSQPDTGLVVRPVRFYRADPGQSPGVTQVTAMLRFPAQLPQPGPDGQVSLMFSMQVRDSAGTVLYQQSWRRRTAVPFPRGDAERLDLIRFSLGSGTYALESSVTDSVSGIRAGAVVPIQAYLSPPSASDLLVSPWVRPVASIDTVPQPGEFRRGNLIVAIAPEVVVGGADASIAYLLETYEGTSRDATLTVVVTDDEGVDRRRIGPTPIRVAAGIGQITGQVELGELRDGRYRLRTEIEVGGRITAREAPFVFAAAVASVPAALSDEAYFGALSGPLLDQAFAPLAAIAPPRELATWPARGSDTDKREFLAAFWRPRDPTPRTVGNERRAQFYDGVTYANAFYGDARPRLPGWQSDRGRVFLREGLPTQVLRRERRGAVPAYEVWRYFEPVSRYYLFVDRGPAGGFVLTRSNDDREAQVGRWREWLTPTGVQEVIDFLGRMVLSPD